MGLYKSAFEDLLSMGTRAYLIKDIDPEVLRAFTRKKGISHGIRHRANKKIL